MDLELFRAIYFVIQVAFLGLVDLIEDALFPDTEYQKPPFEVAVSLKEPGEILSKKVKIKKANNYYFSLIFRANENDDKDRERVKKLMGDERFSVKDTPLNFGTPTPILMIIYKIEGDKKVEIYRYLANPMLDSQYEYNFRRRIGYSELLPGNYLFQLVLPHAVPALNETPVFFDVHKTGFKFRYVPSKCNTLRSNYQSCQP